MRPTSWGQALDALAFLRDVFSADAVLALADASDTQGDPPVARQDVDADGFLTEMPEDMPETECVRRESVQEELDRVRTGEIPIFRREVYTPPEGP